MNVVNQTVQLRLYDLMGQPEGWGRDQGRAVYLRLLNFIESHPGVLVFRISVDQVKRMDISFVSETVVQMAKRYRGRKGFFFIDMTDQDISENCAAAAERGGQPLLVWSGEVASVIGPEPSAGTIDAFHFALRRPNTRVTDFIKENPVVSIRNASNKFKQLWEQGFLLRQERTAESGGVEYVYQRIG